MANYNKVLLMGNLTRDPQLKYLPNQTPVVDFGMAINRRFKGADGQDRDEVCFVDCSAFARTAEVINQYFQKGKPRPTMFSQSRDCDSWSASELIEPSGVPSCSGSRPCSYNPWPTSWSRAKKASEK